MLSPEMNRIVWLVLLSAIAFFGIRARDRFDEYFASVGKLTVRAEPGDTTVTLTWRGRIEAPMASELAKAIAAHQDGTRKFVISLSSPGGSLSHGNLVIGVLSKLSSTHTVETVVDSGARCASMCVPIYLQGHERLAASGALFMFHEVSFRDFYDDAAARVPESSTERATDAFYAKYFNPAGVSQSWLSKVRAEMAGGKDVWQTAQDLVDEQAGIVLRLF